LRSETSRGLDRFAPRLHEVSIASLRDFTREGGGWVREGPSCTLARSLRRNEYGCSGA
ncbi:unnamed protein product, partial [Phaeothamnion confervicola]